MRVMSIPTKLSKVYVTQIRALYVLGGIDMMDNNEYDVELDEFGEYGDWVYPLIESAIIVEPGVPYIRVTDDYPRDANPVIMEYINKLLWIFRALGVDIGNGRIAHYSSFIVYNNWLIIYARYEEYSIPERDGIEYEVYSQLGFRDGELAFEYYSIKSNRWGLSSRHYLLYRSMYAIGDNVVYTPTMRRVIDDSIRWRITRVRSSIPLSII